MMKDDVRDDPNYDQMIDLWIYLPASKRWEQIKDPTFSSSVLFNVNNGHFIQSLRWLNVGAMFFCEGIDPNEESLLSPICFPAEFLKKHGVSQDNLFEATQKGNLAVIEYSESFRNINDEALIARKQKAVEDAKKAVEDSKPKVVTTDQIIELMKQDWQDIALVTEMRLKIISRKYQVDRDGNKVRIIDNGK